MTSKNGKFCPGCTVSVYSLSRTCDKKICLEFHIASVKLSMVDASPPLAI